MYKIIFCINYNEIKQNLCINKLLSFKFISLFQNCSNIKSKNEIQNSNWIDFKILF